MRTLIIVGAIVAEREDAAARLRAGLATIALASILDRLGVPVTPALPEVGPSYVAWSCLGVAALGRVSAVFVPSAPATDAALKINWNPFTETVRNLKLAHESIVVFRSLLGISWMWFFGAVFLTLTGRSLRD